ncbi:unnamed protein product [Miscanthus lutarioriparius]|uniref:Uncharacterized protein n=1 Tax=Miscanthus lutarioriparius TaxID=422564 RepID=A0A811NL88_9POAL|nr:unnamed protein product [Miscanthus lutarioriparius]
MPRAGTLLLLLLAVTVFAASLSASESIGDGSQQVYIVYLGHLPPSTDASEPEGFSAVEFAHHDLLNQVLDDGSSASDRILRSYKRSLNGFAAKLNKEEAHKLSGMNGVVSVFLSRTLDLLTTRSLDFLGFPQTPIEELPLEGDVIIGMLDTGIWPGSPSFSDEGFGPPPSRWKVKSSEHVPTTEDPAALACRHWTMMTATAATRRPPRPGVRWQPHYKGRDSHRRLPRHEAASAGNSGLVGGRVGNVAPWMLSVAASSIDRQFIDRIVLGNGDTIVGASVNTFPTIANATLAFPADGSCDPENLAGGPYKGKIVLCPLQKGRSNGVSGPFLAGAAGVVLVTREPDVAVTLPLPGLKVTQDKFDQIMAYVNSTSNPVGTIDRTVTTGNPQAPVAASFSSPGPTLVTPSILKPDLSAPGVDIIASWSLLSSPSGYPNDTRKVQYNIISGTSMACPHASGAATYVKSLHRDWSPAMIMSALITTATPMNTPCNSNTTALKYGAGQLNPAKAQDPGLVYDTLEGDYVAMLCAQGYNATQLALVTGSNTTACPNGSTSGTPSDLNYPTMAARVEPGMKFSVVFPRTATNVGAAAAVYDVKVVFPVEAVNDLTVVVSPRRLEFSAQGQKILFTVGVSGVAMEEGRVHSGAVVWYNNEHEVRSPVVVYATSDDSRPPSKMGFRQ